MKKTQRRFPVVLLMALFLCVVTILTTPLALSKYAATGGGKAKARVARFEPELRLYYWGYSGHDTNYPLNGGGYVMHPGSWFVPTVAGAQTGPQYFDFVELWLFRNKSEVMTNFQYRLMSYTDLEPSASAHGGFPVGEYWHTGAARTRLDPAVNFGAFVGADSGSGRAWVPARVQMDIPWTGANLGINLASPPAQHSHIFIAGLASPPVRPAGSINSAGTAHGGATNSTSISQSDPIQFGVGSNTISDMKHSWWHSYRVNIDLQVTQVD